MNGLNYNKFINLDIGQQYQQNNMNNPNCTPPMNFQNNNQNLNKQIDINNDDDPLFIYKNEANEGLVLRGSIFHDFINKPNFQVKQEKDYFSISEGLFEMAN